MTAPSVPVVPPAPGRGRCVPWVAAAVFLLLLLPKIDAGTFWHHDELLTANRSRELLVRGDPFAVTVNFAPSVKKPPLQYWACAGLLTLLPGHPELAVRLPTLLGGAACLLAVLLLARTWFPGDGDPLAFGAVLALCGCGYLIHFSRVALLDTNAAFLLALVLVGCRLAGQRDARWWWLACACSVLGAWQKAPYGLAAWGVVLLADRLLRAPETSAAVNGCRWHLPAALGVAVAGSCGWWLVQWLREDHAVLLASGREQIGNFLRASRPADEGFRPWLYWQWLARDWAAVGLAAPVAAVAAVRAGRRDPAAAALGVVCVLFGGITACLPYRAERYLVVITPLLAALTVHTLLKAARRLPPRVRSILLPVVLASTLPVAAFQFFKPAPGRPDLLVAAHALTQHPRSGERRLICTDADPKFEILSFVLFYSRTHDALEATTLPELAQPAAAAQPCRGICSQTQWTQLQPLRPDLRPLMVSGDWVVWVN